MIVEEKAILSAVPLLSVSDIEYLKHISSKGFPVHGYFLSPDIPRNTGELRTMHEIKFFRV